MRSEDCAQRAHTLTAAMRRAGLRWGVWGSNEVHLRAKGRWATHIYGYMAHHGRVVGQPDVLGLVLGVGRARAAIEAVEGRGLWLLLHDEGALDVDLDAARVYYGAIYLGGGGGRPGPSAVVSGSSGRIMGRAYGGCRIAAATGGLQQVWCALGRHVGRRLLRRTARSRASASGRGQDRVWRESVEGDDGVVCFVN